MHLIMTTFLPLLAFCVPPEEQVDSAKKADAKPIVAHGASFSEPKGWKRVATEGPTSKGFFHSPDSDREGHPKAMILIDIMETDEATSRVSATRMAREWGGKVLDEKTTLDGVEASRVQYSKPKSGCRPIEGVLAIKGGKLYVLMGAVAPGRSVAGDLEAVRKGWKWVD